MRHLAWLIGFLALALAGLALPVYAQADDELYTIMTPEKPEPWLAPKYQSPRGKRQHVTTPRSAPVPQPRVQVPPPIYVPETGRVLPNLPVISGSGPQGAETVQDRAARCAHQAGVYGQAAGDRNAYIGSCINQ
jgi:hypothetical protein